RLYVDFPVLDFKSARSDLIHFVDESGLGIRIPEEILLESKISGSLSEMVATVLLKIPEGEVNLDGQFSNNNQIVFNADLQVNELQLNEILQNDQLGAMTFKIHTEGQGSTLYDL